VGIGTGFGLGLGTWALTGPAGTDALVVMMGEPSLAGCWLGP